MSGLNCAVFEALNVPAHAPAVAELALAASRYGTALLAALPLLAVWRVGRRGWALAAQVWLGLLLTSVCVYLLKWGWHWPRPHALGLGHLWVEPSARSSFPSAHAAMSMVAALPMVAWLWRNLPAPQARAGATALLMTAVLVGWSRIGLGVHFPGDVAASWALALCCALAAHRLCAARPVRALAGLIRRDRS